MKTGRLAELMFNIITNGEIVSKSLLPIEDTFPHPPTLTMEHMRILNEAMHQLRSYDAEVKMELPKFSESCYTEETKEFKASFPWVYVDPEGHSITIETDASEGSAMITLPAAKKVYAALARAIEFAESRRRELRK
jgi:hypothetical protein